MQKLPAIKKGAPTPSTSKQVEKAESPIETENSNDSSEEEVIVQKKSPPKKLPDHPALAALPKRRLFKHKDVASGTYSSSNVALKSQQIIKVQKLISPHCIISLQR